ncbi:MAG: hypothetical protein ACLFWD_05185 [Anaerolineales bacterium]
MKENAEILKALELGEIDASEAIRQLEGKPARSDTADKEPIEMPSYWPHLWIIPVAIGVLGLFGGYALGVLGGGWWLLAAPVLVIGALCFMLGLTSIQSPWFHIRVQSRGQGSISEFGLSLPLPLPPAIWLLKQFGGYVPSLDSTAIDELLLAMEGIRTSDGPFFIDVSEEGDGERVRVYFG